MTSHKFKSFLTSFHLYHAKMTDTQTFIYSVAKLTIPPSPPSMTLCMDDPLQANIISQSPFFNATGLIFKLDILLPYNQQKN